MRLMDCDAVQEALVAALDDPGSGFDQEIALHLAACAECGSFSADLASATEALQEDLSELDAPSMRRAVVDAFEAAVRPAALGSERRLLLERLTSNVSRLAVVFRKLGRTYLHFSAEDLVESADGAQAIARFEGSLQLLPTRPVDRPGRIRRESFDLLRDSLRGARALGDEEKEATVERSRALLADAEAYRLAAAERYLGAALSLEPHLVFAMNDLGILRMFSDDPRKSLPVFDAAIELVEQERAVYDSGHCAADALGHIVANRGLALHLLGDEEAALAHHDRALARKRLPATLYNRLLSLLNLGREDDGVALVAGLSAGEKDILRRMAAGDDEMDRHRNFVAEHFPTL